jgi:hypothetical protein
VAAIAPLSPPDMDQLVSISLRTWYCRAILGTYYGFWKNCLLQSKSPIRCVIFNMFLDCKL